MHLISESLSSFEFQLRNDPVFISLEALLVKTTKYLDRAEPTSATMQLTVAKFTS